MSVMPDQICPLRQSDAELEGGQWPIADGQIGRFWLPRRSGLGESCHSVRVTVRFAPDSGHSAKLRLNVR